MSSNGLTPQNKPLISRSTIQKATTPLPAQTDHLLRRNTNTTIGGFGHFLSTGDSKIEYSYHGWGGMGGSMILWNADRSVAVGYAMTAMFQETFWDIERSKRIIRALEECLREVAI